MTELVDWLNLGEESTHPLVKAAMAHLHLVSIHPWCDGNGRMSRSLQTLMIAREGVLAPEFSSIEAWLGRPGNTWEYYRELNARGSRYLPDQDVSDWIRFNLTAYHQQAQTVRKRLNRSRTVLELLTDFTASKGLDDRLVSALHEVAVTGRVRRLRYENAEGLSVQQAQRDLRDLTASGLLESVGRTRARYYTAGPGFPETARTRGHNPCIRDRPPHELNLQRTHRWARSHS
jgi:Fic family protein